NGTISTLPVTFHPGKVASRSSRLSGGSTYRSGPCKRPMTDAPGMPPEVLFERAQELPPAERAAFLERVCGDDPALLEEIRSLLAYAGEAEAFFDALLPVTFPLEPDPLIGRTVAHYELVEELGSGGMGVVYKARDLHLDRFVAVKFLSASWSRDADSKRRFIREAKAASAL